ncbi:hypothetical protein D0819_20635 [Bacillus subtilis]|nr:hypothetical protein BSHJ18_00828 [Bacillus velezensis]QFY87603.1 hypothetical protein D0819_20635 [Bacillus subtilis]
MLLSVKNYMIASNISSTFSKEILCFIFMPIILMKIELINIVLTSKSKKVDRINVTHIKMKLRNE